MMGTLGCHTDHAEQTARNGSTGYRAQNNEPKKTARIPASISFEKRLDGSCDHY